MNSSGIYMVGSTVGALASQTDAGSWDAFLRKYDFDGQEVWTSQFGTTYSDFATAVATDGTAVYLVGQMGAMPWPDARIGEGYLRKYDSSGGVVWTRSITGVYLSSVSADASGVYVAGFPASSVSSGPGFLRKFSAGGDDLWTHPTPAPGLPSSVAAAHGAVYVGSSAPGVLSKYDRNGSELWNRKLVAGVTDYATVTLAVGDSDLYVGGTIRDGALPGQCMAGRTDNYVKRFDPGGAEVWSRQFGTSGPDGIGGMAADDSGIYLAWDHPAEEVSLSLAKLDKLAMPVSEARPRIRFECVVNAASYEAGGIAPGEIVSIFGSGIGPLQPVSASLSGNSASTDILSGTRVLFNGVPAPVLWLCCKRGRAILVGCSGDAKTAGTVPRAAFRRCDHPPVRAVVPAIFVDVPRSGGNHGRAEPRR